jgi:ornithine--oxo-acid transaminase
MLTIKPGEHGSTFGGNPLASVVATESLQVLIDEKMAENAEEMGSLFRQGLHNINSSYIKTIRGKGLMNAIVVDHPKKDAAWKLCERFKENGLLAKPTHGDKIRFAPPLVINKTQMQEALSIIEGSLAVLDMF